MTKKQTEKIASMQRDQMRNVKLLHQNSGYSSEEQEQQEAPQPCSTPSLKTNPSWFKHTKTSTSQVSQLKRKATGTSEKPAKKHARFLNKTKDKYVPN